MLPHEFNINENKNPAHKTTSDSPDLLRLICKGKGDESKPNICKGKGLVVLYPSLRVE